MDTSIIRVASDIIASVGFPISLCIYFIVKFEKTINLMIVSNNRLSDRIEALLKSWDNVK